MSSTYLPYGIVVVIAAITGVLTVFVFFRRSLAKTHAIKLATASLVAVAIALTLFDTFLRPPLPEAFAQCERSGRFAPTTITCTNRSEDYSHIQWTFEDGKDAGSGEWVQRQISAPGTFVITVTAYGKWPATDTRKSFESTFIIEPEPRKEPERKTVVRSFSREGIGGGSYTQVFSADQGFKIVEAQLRIDSANAGGARLVSRTDNDVTVLVELRPKPAFRGLNFRMERSWVNAELVLTLEKIQ